MPVQARSAASVDAILEATLQVLLDLGKERLTTTRVAQRAGVSVGTLYQYFPNKRSLLQAVLRRHFDTILDAIERVCKEQEGRPLEAMGEALIRGFLEAKMRDGTRSVALYSIASDVEGARLMHTLEARANRAILSMLESAREPLARDPRVVASILQGAMSGVSRRLLESGARDKDVQELRDELVLFVCSYLRACASLPSTTPS
ncbi:TetR/AcrR family transcriptional regulator [Acidobacteria bacterium AB60]|nr:TetR/AcrR family transcriptional regulator [Acidobacteria bacterium AB60]